MKSSFFIGTRVEALQCLQLFTTIKLIITEKNSFVHKSDMAKNINCIFVEDFSKKIILNYLSNANVDIVLSAGFKYIIPEDILKQDLIFVNSHPSILPKYKGKKPITDAIKNNEKFIGCTMHYMSKDVDAGKIITQDKINISSFSLEQIYKIIFSFLEPTVIIKGLNILLNDK